MNSNDGMYDILAQFDPKQCLEYTGQVRDVGDREMPYRKTVSIEISPEQTRVAELTNGRKTANVFNVLEFDTPAGCVANGYITDPEKLGNLLRTRLGEAGILTDNAVFTIISEDILVGGAEIERGRKKDIEEEIRSRAQELFGLSGPRQKPEDPQDGEESGSSQGEDSTAGSFDESNLQETDHKGISIDDYYTAYVEQDGSGSDWSMNVIIYAAPKDLIESYDRLAKCAQLNVEATDYIGNSIFQWTRKTFGMDSVMLVDLRCKGSTATILTDGVLRVQVDLMSQTSELVDALRKHQEVLEMEEYAEDSSGSANGEDYIRREAEPLVEEINTLAAEFLSENTDEYIDKILLSSECEGALQMASMIQNRTGIETVTVEDLPKKSLVKDDSVFADLNPSSFLGTIGAVIAPLSFRPSLEGGKRSLSAHERADLITRIMLIIMVVCLILTAALCVTYFILRSHNKALDSSLDQVKYIEDIYEEYQEAEETNRAIRSLDKSTEQKNELISQLFSDLEEKMPSNSKLTSMNASDDMVNFSVSAGDKASAAQFIMQLRKIDYLSDISVSDLTDTKDSAGVTSVDFSVSAYLSGEVVEDFENSDGANDDGISSSNNPGRRNSGDDDDDSSSAIGQTA